jgi:hypothetical protein
MPGARHIKCNKSLIFIDLLPHQYWAQALLVGKRWARARPNLPDRRNGGFSSGIGFRCRSFFLPPKCSACWRACRQIKDNRAALTVRTSILDSSVDRSSALEASQER